MTRDEQVGCFSDDLDKLCNRYAEEFDLSAAEATGILLMKIRMIQDASIAAEKEQ